MTCVNVASSFKKVQYFVGFWYDGIDILIRGRVIGDDDNDNQQQLARRDDFIAIIMQRNWWRPISKSLDFLMLTLVSQCPTSLQRDLEPSALRDKSILKYLIRLVL